MAPAERERHGGRAPRAAATCVRDSMRARGWLILVLVIAAAGGFAYWRLEDSSRPAKVAAAPAPIPVTTTKAAARDFPVILGGLGTVQPLNSVVVRTRVDGQVTQILFKEGETVKQGDLLARIDPRPFQAALDQATAKKDQDEATLKNAKLDLQRYQTLAQKDFATRQQLDTQTATVAQDTAQVAADQGAIDNARIQLGYTEIRAPIAGRVGFRLVDVGNIVNAATQSGILQITQVRPIVVLFTAPEAQIDRINKAMAAGPVPVEADTADGARKLADGTLTVINNQVDTATGTIQIKATFQNADDALWPGLSVVTRTRVDTLKNVVVLPLGAVQHGQNDLWAYVVDKDNKARRRTIEVGDSNEDEAVITRGVSPGDRVVVAGQYRLGDGSAVTEAPPETAENGRSG